MHEFAPLHTEIISDFYYFFSKEYFKLSNNFRPFIKVKRSKFISVKKLPLVYHIFSWYPPPYLILFRISWRSNQEKLPKNPIWCHFTFVCIDNMRKTNLKYSGDERNSISNLEDIYVYRDLEACMDDHERSHLKKILITKQKKKVIHKHQFFFLFIFLIH